MTDLLAILRMLALVAPPARRAVRRLVLALRTGDEVGASRAYREARVALFAERFR